jgi:hypothetical protein
MTNFVVDADLLRSEIVASICFEDWSCRAPGIEIADGDC